MQLFILFLEGIITFISPCLLPMIPIYISFFAGGRPEEQRNRTVLHALAFVAGFSSVFILFGAFAGTLGSLLVRYQTIFHIVTGAIVVIFGLNYLGVLKIGFLNRTVRGNYTSKGHTAVSSFVFGVVFSIGWTPCVGAFLGSALLMASQKGSAVQGILMLLVYSLGLGIPFVLSALLIERLKGAFTWIKQHYRMITAVSGGLLVIVGILMMFGVMERLLAVLQ